MYEVMLEITAEREAAPLLHGVAGRRFHWFSMIWEFDSFKI